MLPSRVDLTGSAVCPSGSDTVIEELADGMQITYVNKLQVGIMDGVGHRSCWLGF